MSFFLGGGGGGHGLKSMGLGKAGAFLNCCTLYQVHVQIHVEVNKGECNCK